MPTTALSTTKRKFHKILDSISNASSTSLVASNDKHNASTTTLPSSMVASNDKHNASTTTLPSSMHPPTKRLRVARPSSAYVTPSTRMATTPAAKARPLSVIGQPATSTLDTERKPPNFAPWDRGQFLERLKTYRHVGKWMGKPDKINEVQWAKRGWSCVEKERVGCVGGCGKEVVITLEGSRENKENADEKTAEQEEAEEDEDEWRDKAQAQLVEKYAEMIATSHEGGCLWRRRGCDDTIQRLPLAHQGTAIANLRQRYLSLLAMASDLPSNPTVPENFDISKIQEHLLPLIDQSSTDPPATVNANPPSPPSVPPADPNCTSTLNHSAFALAFFGWQAEEGHISGLATCTACFRRLGLWLFKPASDSSNTSSMDRLDVVDEHREYCPWINALSQSGAASRRSSLDGLAGWQVLLRAVNASRLHKKYDSEVIVDSAPAEPDDTATEVASVMSLATTKVDRKDEDEKDKERWAKLKRLKQVFHVKRVKGKNATGGRVDQNLTKKMI